MPTTCQIALHNDSNLSNLHAYISGIALQKGHRICLLKANGRDLYFPGNPAKARSPLQEDCAIPLGKPGNTVRLTVPQIGGGRTWLAEGKLTFSLNPGPALVEPSVLNPSDPNYNINFAFCEFTLDASQLYANLSYVDFVPRLPVAITLQSKSGQVQHVGGMAPDGLDKIANDLAQQAKHDKRAWDKLIIKHGGQNLRVLNVTHGDSVGAAFHGYYEPYVDKVWHHYRSGAQMKVDTQCGFGVIKGHVNAAGELVIGQETFSKPTTADIWGCNTGPFTTGNNQTRNVIIPRLAAGFVRSCLIDCADQPASHNAYYATSPTNHYARIVHIHNLDSKGYAFAYDDVRPNQGPDQSGMVNSGDPSLFTISVGGKSASKQPPKHIKMISAEAAQQPPEVPLHSKPNMGQSSESHHSEFRYQWMRKMMEKVEKRF